MLSFGLVAKRHFRFAVLLLLGMSLHYTDNKANPGTSVARTPFLIEDILYQHSNSLKLNLNSNKQCGNGGVINNNNNINSNNNNNHNNSASNHFVGSANGGTNGTQNNGKVNGDSNGGKTNRASGENISAMHSTEEDYRKLLQNDR